MKDPTYQNIGDHTETFQVDFDPARISYEQLLDLFWKSHDPSTKSWSVQYRSAVFTMNDEQSKIATASKERFAKAHGKVETSVEPLREFTWAEDYHQKYTLRNNKAFVNELKRFYSSERDLENSTAAARLNAYLAGNGKASQFEAEIGKLGLTEDGQKRLREKVKGRLRADDDAAASECGAGAEPDPLKTK